MSITLQHQQVLCTIKPNDEVAAHAAAAYGFVLNTPERRNKPHDGPAFADAIAEVCGTDHPTTRCIVRHLRTSA